MEQTFYTLKAEREFDQEKFLQFYEKEYFRRNGESCDDTIENILRSPDNLGLEDIHTILLWKTGGRGMNQVELGKIYEAVKDIKRSDFSGPFQDGGMSISEEKECIYLLEKLADPYGMGMVYAITILYFLSNGKYPIYDRFACVAIDAVCAGNKLRDRVECCEISTSAGKAFTGKYREYCKKIYGVFGEAYLDRRVDRALWAYGHFFNF